MHIGFIGLGTMGRPMVEHLIRAGHQLFVWARRPTATDFCQALGARVCASPAELAAQCEVVCTNVYSDTDVETLAFGPEGIALGLPADGIHLDFSTISPSMARSLARRYVQRGAYFVDAPVSGGGVGAQAATLTIMWGGQLALADRLNEVFPHLGKTIVRIGEAGDGQVAKACNQMIMVAAIEACAEAAHLASAAGIDFAKVREALLGGSAASKVLDVFGGRMAERNFQAGVMSRLHQKDFLLLLNEATRLGVPVPVAASVCQQLNAVLALGQGEKDTSCLVHLLEMADQISQQASQ